MKKILTVICALVLSMACIFGLTACGEQPKVKLVSVALTQEEYAFAMKLDNTALQTSFNEYLAEIKDNGTFDAIMAKYFVLGESIDVNKRVKCMATAY